VESEDKTKKRRLLLSYLHSPLPTLHSFFQGVFMPRNLSELANIINEKFSLRSDNEILRALRRQIISSDPQENRAAIDMLASRGVQLSDEEFAIIRDYTIFEAQKSAKMMKSTAYTYIFLGVLILTASIYIRNRLSIFGIIAAALLIVLGYSLLKKSKRQIIENS